MAQEKDLKWWKKLIRFIFSQVGMVLTVLMYIVIGGFIFEHLEKTDELERCVARWKAHDLIVNETLEIMYKLHIDALNSQKLKNDTQEDMRPIVNEYAKKALEMNYQGQNCTLLGKVASGINQYKWTWSGGVLFASTAITTIGYGNISPETTWGMIVCVAYATLGIPLMMLCLANVGEMMADIFRFFYVKVCCCGFCRCCCCACCANAGRISGARVQWHNPRKAATKIDFEEDPNIKDTRLQVQAAPGEITQDDLDGIDYKGITVPLTVTMTFIFGYITGGAVLFAAWEDWDFLEGFYFSFVTLTTIGFGDYVPGEASNSQVKLVLTGIYVLFGMALLSMGFSLMQDEMVSKVRWLGEKCAGKIRKKDEEEETDSEDSDSEDDGDYRRFTDDDDDMYDAGGRVTRIRYDNGVPVVETVTGRRKRPVPSAHKSGRRPSVERERSSRRQMGTAASRRDSSRDRGGSRERGSSRERRNSRSRAPPTATSDSGRSLESDTPSSRDASRLGLRAPSTTMTSARSRSSRSSRDNSGGWS